MNFLKKNWSWILTLYVAIVFIQSLFFKFTGSAETVYIFQGKLDPWAASLGFPGVFAPGGIFSAKVVGTFELIASVLLVLGAPIHQKTPWVQIAGAGTPLGVAVANTDGSSDGGELFMLACGVWVACAWLLYLNRSTVLALLKK